MSATGFVSSPGNVVAMETERQSLAEAGVEPMQVEPDRGGVNSAAMKEVHNQSIIHPDTAPCSSSQLCKVVYHHLPSCLLGLLCL